MRARTEAIKAARPHALRGVVATLVAVAGAVMADLFGELQDGATERERVIAIGGAIVVLLAGVIGVRSFSTAVRRGAEAKDAGARGASLAFLTSVVGYIVVVLATLGVLRVNLAGLLLGGAVTGVVVGIAAQQTIGNFFAGIVLLAVRPFSVGERVVMRSGPLGGEYEGTVTDMSLFYVHLLTTNGPVALPNAGVLASAIGPGARAAKDEPKVEMDEEPPA